MTRLTGVNSLAAITRMSSSDILLCNPAVCYHHGQWTRTLPIEFENDFGKVTNGEVIQPAFL